jgi:ABC-type uncharacterized transport system involved in gliding motility auxiliary subunit/ABC-type transport system involved in multi-copper enzyme maturation permease subunit
MRRVWTVIRREIASYFDHPTAYVLIIAFLGLSLFLTFRTLYAQKIATLRPLFDLLPWLFAVFVPAITMRSLAEERRGHTLEWLTAQPLGESEIVAGKFIGDWLVILLGLAATVPTAIGVLLVSKADAGIVVAQYVGAALLAAELAAIGIWASSVTRNQITAFILGAAAAFVLILIGLPVVQVGLPPVLAGAAARLSVIGHFDNVARGVIDLRDVIYFLSVAILFLALAATALSGERLSHERGAWRRLRLGTTVALALVVFVNLLGGHIRGRLDLTRDGQFTLASGSRDIMGGLDDVVNLKLFVSKELPPEVQLSLRDVRDLVADLARASNGRLHVQEINPDDDADAAAEANSFGIREIEFNVLRDTEFQVKRGWFGLALQYADKQQVFPLIDRTDDLEYRLVSAIATLTAGHKPHLAFASGFGAKGAYDFPSLQQAVSDRYDVSTVDLQAGAAINRDSVDVLVLAAPTQPLGDSAKQALEDYAARGGSLLLLLESSQINPQYPIAMGVNTGLGDFLAAHGVKLDAGMVYDLRSHANVSLGRQGMFSIVRGYPLWPVVVPAHEHATTRSLENLSLGWAGSVEITDTTKAVPLWETTEDAGLTPSEASIDPQSTQALPTDSLHTRIVAAAIGGAPAATQDADEVGPRIVVVADADFLQDQFIGANPQNLIFAANAIDWLAQDEAVMGIRSKNRTPPALVFESDFSQRALKWGNLAGVPLLLAAFGVLRTSGRRRRAMRWWDSPDRQ